MGQNARRVCAHLPHNFVNGHALVPASILKELEIIRDRLATDGGKPISDPSRPRKPRTPPQGSEFFAPLGSSSTDQLQGQLNGPHRGPPSTLLLRPDRVGLYRTLPPCSP